MKMFRFMIFSLLLVALLAGCVDPLSLIESARDEIDFSMETGACRDEQWVVPGGAEIKIRLTNPLDMQQVFIIMARAATPPFDIQDQDRIFFSVPVPPGFTESSFTAPTMPSEYQVICGPSDKLEPLGRNRLVVVQSGLER